MAEFQTLRVETRGETAVATIDRPADRNSLDSALMAELAAALGELETGRVRAVIFTGAGGEYFIGGADGIEMMQCSPAQAWAFSRRIQALFDQMERSPLILVAAIDGLCFGGGYEFALACDLRVATARSRIGLPEVKVGLIPGGGGTQRLPRLVGTGRAMEMILSGRLHSGQEALDLGLVNRLAAEGRLLEEAEALLTPILRQPAQAVSLAKRAVKAGQGLAAGLEAEAGLFARCFEVDFFPKLMKEQLRSGRLSTTARLPEGFLKPGA